MPADNNSTGTSRRQFLKYAALGTGVVGTAGYLSVPPLGDRFRYGRLDAPAADPPAYRRWLPSMAVYEGDRDGYAFAYAEPANRHDATPPELHRKFGWRVNDIDYFGIGVENYDSLLSTPFGSVVQASFDADAVAETMSESGFERDGSLGDFVVFSRTDIRRRVAVGDGVVLHSSETDESPNLEALLAAERGNIPRHHETNAAVEAVTDAIGASPYVVGAPWAGDPVRQSTFSAIGYRFDDDGAYKVFTHQYPAGGAPSADQLREGYRDVTHYPDDATVDISVDGQFATVEALFPIDGSATPPESADIPHVTWGADYDPDTDSVTVRHEAGERVDAAWLWADVARPDDHGELQTDSLWADQRTVAPGDEATIDLRDHADADGVRIVYTHGRTHSSILFTYDVTDR